MLGRRANTPREPFLPVGGSQAAPQLAARQSHLLVCDPACDRRLLTAFLRPPLRRCAADCC